MIEIPFNITTFKNVFAYALKYRSQYTRTPSLYLCAYVVP